MQLNAEFGLAVLAFFLLIISSRQIGDWFTRANLPRITGFLFTGMLIGPFALSIIQTDAVHALLFVDQTALAFIAFAAGSELYLPELRGRMGSIGWVTGVQLVSLIGSVVAIFFLADLIPFMADLPSSARWAVSFLAGVLLLARSPSSAIAIINELRAKGPFTQSVLGVTVIMDVIVIVLFAISTAVATGLIEETPIDLGFAALLIIDLALALGFGILLYLLLDQVLRQRMPPLLMTILVVGIGYVAFAGIVWLDHITPDLVGTEIHMEPLLVCMVAGFLVNNRSRYRAQFSAILRQAGPIIYVAFFTLTGASLELDVFFSTWPIALLLFAVRAVSIMIGSVGGGLVARDPLRHTQVKWMTFLTQAGVALGLAKEVADSFPAFGSAFATMIISVVVINQLIGPPVFKFAIGYVGEARQRARREPFDGQRDALIFGADFMARGLVRQLAEQNWRARLVIVGDAPPDDLLAADASIQHIDHISAETLTSLNASGADAVVAMLPDDDDNYAVCETFYEQFGTRNLVVRLNDGAQLNRFHALGVRIIDPRTAMISLLDHFVRSPSAASLLLGMVENEDVIDIEIRDPLLNGVRLQELRLPPGVLILSVTRDGQTLITHGYTQLKMGDEVSVLGPPEELDRVLLKFDG